MPRYVDDKGRIISVHKGLYGEGSNFLYGAFWAKNGVGFHRIKSSSLPMVLDPVKAQENLDKYAKSKGYVPFD